MAARISLIRNDSAVLVAKRYFIFASSVRYLVSFCFPMPVDCQIVALILCCNDRMLLCMNSTIKSNDNL